MARHNFATLIQARLVLPCDVPGRFRRETNSPLDTDHCIIVNVEATPGRLSQDVVAANLFLVPCLLFSLNPEIGLTQHLPQSK